MLAFGPVPSRRLGRSVGVNNIPPKICSYSCVYCQLGRTRKMQARRMKFHEPDEILADVKKLLTSAGERHENVDYLTFVPDGEPTLDINLGPEMEMLKELGIPMAVISNASLIWMEDVRQELAGADWVSLKVDAITPETWYHVDRPHGSLVHQGILDGMAEFSDDFRGRLVTETMLVQGLNDSPDELEKIAAFLKTLNVDMSYISIPIRPPAEADVRPPSEDAINRAYQIFAGRGLDTELLTGYEGNAFASTGNVEEDMLSITSVHPMREDAVRELLGKTGADWEAVEELVEQGKLAELEYSGKIFYLRRFGGRKPGDAE